MTLSFTQKINGKPTHYLEVDQWKPVKIEVKFSKSDRQSDYQKQYEQDVKRSGGLYWLVRNQDEFYGIFNGS